jgi:hypothetical protein
MTIGITDADIPLMAHPRVYCAYLLYYARRLILHYQHGGYNLAHTHLLAVFFSA